jgi:hypothetical protein
VRTLTSMVHFATFLGACCGPSGGWTSVEPATVDGAVPTQSVTLDARVVDSGCEMPVDDTTCDTRRREAWGSEERRCEGGDAYACINVAHALWRGCCLGQDRAAGRALYLASCGRALERLRREGTLSPAQLGTLVGGVDVYCPRDMRAVRPADCMLCADFDDEAYGTFFSHDAPAPSCPVSACPPFPSSHGIAPVVSKGVTGAVSRCVNVPFWERNCPLLPGDPLPAQEVPEARSCVCR